jgi:hypothetical protein
MSEDAALEAFTDFLNAVEAGIAAAKQRIKEAKKVGEEQLDFNKLFWEQKQGDKGPFQQTSEKTNNNCDFWKQLKAKLQEHNGFWQNRGFKYWFDMGRDDVIDRRGIV